MTWRDSPMVGFDTETDGPDPEDARIITACVGVASSEGWKPQSWMVRPERPIPEEATSVHGITTDHARLHGSDRPQAIREIRDAIGQAWAAGYPLVAHNIVYDLTVLDRELRRIGEPGLTLAGHVIDTLTLDKYVDKWRRGSRSLIDTATHYGIHLSEGDAHGADADALASCRIAWKIGARYRLDDLAALQDVQQQAYREQRDSFAAYLARQGKSLDDPSRDWPVRPYPQAATQVA